LAKRLTKEQAASKAGADKRLYTLDVFIINGLMTARFVKKNRVISRTIQIRGNQTLEVLHNTIFYAFDREDNHMYEFQISGKGPMDPKARRYTLYVFKDDGNPPAGDVEWTTIGSLGLKVGDAFGYWFDFGDDWWHQINVVAIEDVPGRGKFPKIVKRVGESPPQYADWDEEEEED
jgi:Plasmid pRiA4b ORF-3-like protein